LELQSVEKPDAMSSGSSIELPLQSKMDWLKWTLKALADHPKARKFVEPLIEPPAEEIARAEARKIDVRQPARAERPSPELAGRGVYAALTTPNGLILIGALFLANLYAGYEIARFRWRPVPLVCGLSAVLPVIGPLIFLMLPRREEEVVVNATEEAAAAQQLNVPPPAAAPSAPAAHGASGLGISKHAAAGAAQELPRVFKRGETTFNRRFFETQFPSFFRVVASEADKDLIGWRLLGTQSLSKNGQCNDDPRETRRHKQQGRQQRQRRHQNKCLKRKRQRLPPCRIGLQLQHGQIEH
jgi:hypothetical protein